MKQYPRLIRRVRVYCRSLSRGVPVCFVALALHACGDDDSSAKGACDSLCDCVSAEVGEAARSDCMSQCNALRNTPNAQDECLSRLEANGISNCDSRCTAFAKSDGNWQSCTTDGDCSAGEGCDTEDGELADGYCTPLCDEDAGCPTGYDCPSGAKNQPGECDERGDHAGRGICDQFDGVYGPTTCSG